MDYDLTGLGWRHFDIWSARFFHRRSASRSDSLVMDPTEGREATFRGLTKKLGPDESPWNGYTLLQAKFRTRPLGTQADQDWLISEVDKSCASGRARHPLDPRRLTDPTTSSSRPMCT